MARDLYWREVVGGTELRRALCVRFKRILLRHGRGVARCELQPTAVTIPRELGFAVVDPERLAKASAAAEAARHVVASAKPLAVGVGKSYLRTGLLDMARLDLESSYLRLALDDEVTTAVSRYLGVVPILNNVDVWCSRFVPERPSSSRLFHCDWADTTQVKMFVYATDVAEGDGPLVLLDARQSCLVRRRVDYRFDGPRYRLRDDEVRSILGPDCERTVLGRSGTTVFADTSRCFHYGSRISEGAEPRILIQFQYLTPFAFELPLRYTRASRWQHLDSPGLSHRQRLILGLS